MTDSQNEVDTCTKNGVARLILISLRLKLPVKKLSVEPIALPNSLNHLYVMKSLWHAPNITLSNIDGMIQK